MRVDDKTLHELEFDYVLDLVKSEAFSDYGRAYFKEFKAVEDPVKTFFKTEYVLERMERIANAFYRLKDVRIYLESAVEGKILEYEELKAFFDFFIVFENLKREIGEDSPFNFFRMESFFRKFVHEFSKTFSSDGTLRDNASTNLSKFRKTLRKLEKEADEKVKRLLYEGLNKGYVNEALTIQRHDRYVLPVIAAKRNLVRGIVHGQSSTASTFYVEPEELIALNDALALTRSQERIEISRIFSTLTKMLVDEAEKISLLIKGMKEFDGICARAKYAIKNNCAIPSVKKDGSVKIVGGRNPLIPNQKVVPIDFVLSKNDSVIILSGPNTGGKTATLKTVGIFVLMTAMGIPVPASGRTEISIFDELISDIGDDQSVKNELSTFSAKVKRENEICERANENSLILIDEMGDGTEPTEGVAFARAVLEVLMERGAKVVVTTHLPELKTLAFNDHRVRNASVGFDLNEMSPTYKIHMDMPGRSHAFEIIKKIGVSKTLVENFQKYRQTAFSKTDQLVERLQTAIQEYEMRIEILSEKERNLKIKEERFDRKFDALKNKKLEELDERIRILSKEITNTVKEMEKAVHLLKEGEKPETLKSEIKRLIGLKKRLQENSKEPKKNVVVDKIKVGSHVRIKDTDVVGKVMEISEDNGKAIVESKGIRLEVNLENVEAIEWKEKDSQENVELHYVSSESFQSEIDIRGMTVEEAIPIVEEFSDRVLKFKTIGYIIHGKGTGKLANGIWTFLRSKKIPFRLGKSGEGGSGVTVIGGEAE